MVAVSQSRDQGEGQRSEFVEEREKKEGGKEEGTGWLVFQYSGYRVAWNPSHTLRLHSSLSYSHKSWTNKVPGDLQQHSAHHLPAHVTPEVRCAPTLLILPVFFNWRHFFLTNTMQGELFLHLPVTMTKWTMTGSKEHEEREGCQ